MTYKTLRRWLPIAYRLPEERRNYLWTTLVWVSGLIFGAAIVILWLGILGAAIFELLEAHGDKQAITYIAVFAVVLLSLVGAAFVKFVNWFYEWHLDQRTHSLLKEIDDRVLEAQTQTSIDRLESGLSAELSETFKNQLRSSATFRVTVTEAMNLLEEAAAFARVPHSDVERDAFRKSWDSKMEKFAERIAEGDPLAMEVILKAIERESERRNESQTD